MFDEDKGITIAPAGQSVSEMLNVGSVAIERARAVAEAQAQIMIAKSFPRDLMKARKMLLESCSMLSFAEQAFYTLPRGRESVTGPSIRFAEEVSRCLTNMEYGHRELSRSDGKSEVEVFAWDKEFNNRSIRQITVEHFRDKSGGNVKLTYSRDIDDKIANVASKQVRSRILAISPKWLIQEGLDKCRETLNGGAGVPMMTRITNMSDRMEQIGVTPTMLADYLGHPVQDTSIAELDRLMGVFGAIKGGEPIELFFGQSGDGEDSTENKKLQDIAIGKAKERQEQARLAREAKEQAAKGEVIDNNTGEVITQQQTQQQSEQTSAPAAANQGAAQQNAGAAALQKRGVSERRQTEKVTQQGTQEGAGETQQGNAPVTQTTERKRRSVAQDENGAGVQGQEQGAGAGNVTDPDSTAGFDNIGGVTDPQDPGYSEHDSQMLNDPTDSDEPIF